MRVISALVVFCGCAFGQDLVRQGLTQFNAGEYVAARDTLQRALTAEPGSQQARTFLALSRAATGACDQAVVDLGELSLTAKNPELKRLAGAGLIQCHLAKEQLAEATEVATRLRAEFSSDADVLYQAARVHMKAWNQIVEQMFQKIPASFRVNQLSAEIFEVQGNYAAAVAEYRKAIAKNPLAINLHYRLGRALLMESHNTEALTAARQEFEAELKLNPNDAVAHYQVGQILLSEQKPEPATAHFKKAIAIDPQFAEALVALAKVQPDQAVALLEQAVAIQPKNERARYSLMLAYRNAGRTADAQREKAELDKLQKPPEGEFTEFLKKLGEKAPKQ